MHRSGSIRARVVGRLPSMFLALLLLDAPPLAAQQPIHKWIDKDGRTHFGDRPPEGVLTEPLEVAHPPVPTAPQPAAGTPVEATAPDNPPPGPAVPDTRGPEAQARNARELQQECRAARRALEVLAQRMPVYRDAGGTLRAKWRGDTYRGERRYLDDNARAIEQDRTLQSIAGSCANPQSQREQQVAHDEFVREEYCARARVVLADMQRESAHTTRSDLEKQQARVAELCGH